MLAKEVVWIAEVREVATLDNPFVRTVDDGKHTLFITRVVS